MSHASRSGISDSHLEHITAIKRSWCWWSSIKSSMVITGLNLLHSYCRTNLRSFVSSAPCSDEILEFGSGMLRRRSRTYTGFVTRRRALDTDALSLCYGTAVRDPHGSMRDMLRSKPLMYGVQGASTLSRLPPNDRSSALCATRYSTTQDPLDNS